MKLTFRPLNDRVLIRPSEAEKKTPGGIIIPDNAKEKPTRGEVLAVGPGKLLDNGERAPMPVWPGQVVWYSKYSGMDVELEGEDLRVVSIDDVMLYEE